MCEESSYLPVDTKMSVTHAPSMSYGCIVGPSENPLLLRTTGILRLSKENK